MLLPGRLGVELERVQYLSSGHRQPGVWENCTCCGVTGQEEGAGPWVFSRWTPGKRKGAALTLMLACFFFSFETIKEIKWNSVIFVDLKNNLLFDIHSPTLPRN